ncbi:hypothetical protein K8I31_17665, partial [bacterium]|nr:hypothetical protein [bacterium]
MKKSICLVASCLLVAAFSVMPQAQVIASYDFSTASGYTDGPLVGQGEGDYIWTIATSDLTETRFAVENEQLVCDQTVPNTVEWVYVNIPVQNEQFSCEWDWQFIRGAENVDDASSSVDFGFTLSDTVNFNNDGNPDANWPECGVMVRMNTDPDLDARNGDWAGGGAYEADVAIDYRDEANYHMRVVVDAFENIFDVYITRDNDDEVQMASGYGFRVLTSAET